ncbi:alpha/beta hydrolase family protein [Glycomyces xiaoerkulensis]|uniref:alpha/beta hydrolase family protein n=1 Tax=Glycomyces xiaoerkulensis TaxID=2038139 RepID=UPI000C264DB2|nr:alpha/beta fold hydrolase [Glycomyces xiaoerkulensis]
METLDLTHAGRTLRGVLHLPGSSPAPAVVLCHGFGGNRMEFGNVFVDLARSLTERGLAAYRFDFAGHGDSDGDFADLTVSDQVEQAQAAVEAVAAHQAVEAERMALMGMSLGGLTASLVAARLRFPSLALWAPAAKAAAANKPEEDHRWTAVAEHGFFDLGGKPIHRRFLDDAFGIDPWADAAGHDGPALMASGTADDLITDDVIERYRELYDDRLEEHRFEAVGHAFETVAARERLVETTADFLARNT